MIANALFALFGCASPAAMPPAPEATPSLELEAAPTETATDRCGQAFDHMTAVSMKEIDTLPPDQQAFAREATKKLEAGEPARREKFLAKCNAGEIDVECILKASDTMAYVGCFTK